MTVNMGDTANTTGAGAIDSWHQVAISCGKVQQEHGGDLAAVGVELGINLVSAALDTVALVMDPFGKLIAAGLGWLIEHIKVLKEPLDQVAGDPAEVSKLASELHKIGEALRIAGDDLDKNLKSTITKWEGAGHDSFVKSINDRKGWIDANAKAADVAGYMVETTGAMISAVRALIRDIITTVLGDIIATMLIALAAAAFTFGASIAVGVTKCVIATAASVASMMAKLAKVMGFGGRTLARLTQVANKLKAKSGSGTGNNNIPLQTLPSGTRPPGSTVPNFSRPLPPPGTAVTHDRPGGGATPSARPGGGTVPNFSRPLPKPAPKPVPNFSRPLPKPQPKPKPQSALSSADVQMIKKHEGWLDSKFPKSDAKRKWADNWFKNNAPDYYPMLKALSDAKSSKNFAGWGGKSIVQIDRSLTDIQSQAEAAWAEEQKNQQNQPQ